MLQYKRDAKMIQREIVAELLPFYHLTNGDEHPLPVNSRDAVCWKDWGNRWKAFQIFSIKEIGFDFFESSDLRLKTGQPRIEIARGLFWHYHCVLTMATEAQ